MLDLQTNTVYTILLVATDGFSLTPHSQRLAKGVSDHRFSAQAAQEGAVVVEHRNALTSGRA